MRLTYQTGIGTLIQFLVLTFLNIPNSIVGIVQGCKIGNCETNAVATIVFFLLLVVWFAFLWIIGTIAQQKRSRRLTVFLAGSEFVTLAIAAYLDLDHKTNLLQTITGIIYVVIGLLVIYLCFNLFVAGKGRMVKGRVRRKVTDTIKKNV